MSRPDLPRASSAMSAFFFCGMIDEPVANASSSSTQPNSCEVQSTTSSPSRDRCTPISAVTKRNSATKSRSATASIELANGVREAQLLGHRAPGPAAAPEPASAPAPSGLTAARWSQSRSRSRSRSSGCTWASSWCPKVTGWACCRWVMPGRGACRRAARPARPAPRPARPAGRPRPGRGRAGRAAGRWRPGRCGTGRRAACRRALPSRSSRPRSSAVCTSSSSTVGRNAPEAQAASRSSSAASIRPSSSGSSRPAPARTRACAREPARSYGARRQSNCTLTDSRASASAGPPANRPPQRLVRLVAALFSVRLLSSTSPIIALLAFRRDCGAHSPCPVTRWSDSEPAVMTRALLSTVSLAGGPSRRACRRGGPADGLAGHDEDGVVAGDGADDLGQARPVQRAGQELGGARRGAQHGEVAAGVDAGEQLAQQPDQPGRGLPRRRAAAARRPRGSGRRPAVAAAHLDRAQLLQVPREGGLGDLHAVARRAGRPARSASGPPGRGSAPRSGRAGPRGSAARSSRHRCGVAGRGRPTVAASQPGTSAAPSARAAGSPPGRRPRSAGRRAPRR